MTQSQMRETLDHVIEHYNRDPQASIATASSIINDAILHFPDFLIAPNYLGYSILHTAASHDALGIIKLLLLYGCDTNITMDITNFTPLHFATADGYTDCALALIAISPISLNALDMNGCTPLYLAAVNGHIELASTLIEHGANPDIVRDLLISFLIDPSNCARIHPLSFGLVEMTRHDARLDRLVTPLIQALDPKTNMPMFDVNCKNQYGNSILDAAMLNAYTPLKIKEAARDNSSKTLKPQMMHLVESMVPDDDWFPDAKRSRLMDDDDEMLVPDGTAVAAHPSFFDEYDSRMGVSPMDERDIVGDEW